MGSFPSHFSRFEARSFPQRPGIPIAADVFTGHRVTVRYMESAGKKEAESVMVRELAKEKPAATSGTAKKQPTGTSGEK